MMEELPLFSEPGGVHPSNQTSPLNPKHSLSAAINAWGEALEAGGKSIHTVKAFSGDLRLLARYLGGGQALDAIGLHDLKNFLDWMLNQRKVACSPKTYARRVTSIKSFFRWLVDSGVLADSPADAIPQQTVLSPLPDVLTPEEVEAVRQAAENLRHGPKPDPRPATLLNLLLETGIKKGECLGIHLSHIDLFAPQGPILFVRYGDVSKRYKERKLNLSQEWVAVYRQYLAIYDPQDRLFPWSPRRLEYLLEDLSKSAGLEKSLSFDVCRWTSALGDYLAGEDPNKIRQKLGVSKIQWREIGNKLDRLAIRQRAGS